MKLPFVKMHGAGNDLILLNGIGGELPVRIEDFAKKICHRRFGIGADQLLIVKPSDKADFTMDIYNADGSRVEMCGNGIRCFVKYLRDEGISDKEEISVETLAGVVHTKIRPDHFMHKPDCPWIEVDMGQAILEGENIPVRQAGRVVLKKWSPADPRKLLATDPQEFLITCVSMGNPHCVIYVDDVDKFPVERIGAVIERDPFFPKRTNVEFVQVLNEREVKQRTWERGAGETLACGSGACAVGVAGVLTGKSHYKVRIELKGGFIDIKYDENENRVLMSGPAATVFRGEIDV